MTSMATILALVFLSCLPVARADIHCDFSIAGTNVCSWANLHGGVIIAVVGAIAALVVFLGFSVYACLFQSRVSPTPMSYAPSAQPRVPSQQIAAPYPAVLPSPYETQPYAFSVRDEGWQSSHPAVPDKGWSNVDLSRQAYSAYARPAVQSSGSAYKGYAV